MKNKTLSKVEKYCWTIALGILLIILVRDNLQANTKEGRKEIKVWWSTTSITSNLGEGGLGGEGNKNFN